MIGLFYWLKWALLLTLAGTVAGLHWLQQKRLTALLGKGFPTFQPMVSALFFRSLQVLCLLALCVLVIVIHDIRVIYQPPIAVAQSSPPPVVPVPVKPAAAPPVERDSGFPFEGIPVFSERDAATQSYLDLVKQRYEKLFVTYYYLLQCKAVDAEDFALLQSSLQTDLAKVKAPAGTGGNVLQAAAGTYSEIYARSACHQEEITPIKQSFADSLRQLRQRGSKSGG